jgi:antitoxin ChpS
MEGIMHETTLREVGGTVMLAVPEALLDELNLKVGSSVAIGVADGHFILAPTRRRSRYTLEELISQCDPNAPVDAETREWLDAPSVGKELL